MKRSKSGLTAGTRGGGQNRETEEQWITEIPDDASKRLEHLKTLRNAANTPVEPDFDPAKAARNERTAHC